MGTFTAHEDSRLNLWLHVRRYAVPPLMIEAATARRRVGDWAGACAVAGFDIDFTPRSVARTHGWALAHQVRTDLRQLAPDLLRWHMPRIAPDGLLRPGVTVPLARYDTGDVPPLHLVAKTPPLRAAAGQRIGLALWDGRRELTRTRAQAEAATRAHPHPLPSRRFRLDLHRHLWDAARAHELRGRTGGADAPGDLGPAVHRWAAEAQLLRRAEGATGPVAVRLGPGRRTALHLATTPDGVPRITAYGATDPAGLPLLPDAATWNPPDLALLAAGLLTPDELHPLVAAALAPDHAPTPRTYAADTPRHVDCRGARHRIALVDGVLTALDHDPAEIRRESLLAALSGTPLPCLRVIDEAHRSPESLPEIRSRLDHGDARGALAAVESLLGPAALLRDGPLRDELTAAAAARTHHALYRANLPRPAPPPPPRSPR